MSRPATRLTRLVELARLQEDQARQSVAVARTAERAARSRVEAGAAALRDTAVAQAHPTGPGAFRFQSTLRQLGRETLRQAEDHAHRASAAVEADLDAWRDRYRKLGTLERLDDRLHDAAMAARRQQEQRETDELATTRVRVQP